jgi:hypothetical protein
MRRRSLSLACWACDARVLPAWRSRFKERISSNTTEALLPSSIVRVWKSFLASAIRGTPALDRNHFEAVAGLIQKAPHRGCGRVGFLRRPVGAAKHGPGRIARIMFAQVTLANPKRAAPRAKTATRCCQRQATSSTRYFCAGWITRQDSAVGTGSTFTSMRLSGTHMVICCPTFRSPAGVSLPST